MTTNVDRYREAARQYTPSLEEDGTHLGPLSRSLNVAYPADLTLPDLTSALELRSPDLPSQELSDLTSELHNVLILEDYVDKQGSSIQVPANVAWDLRRYLSVVPLPGSIWAEPSPFHAGMG